MTFFDGIWNGTGGYLKLFATVFDGIRNSIQWNLTICGTVFDSIGRYLEETESNFHDWTLNLLLCRLLLLSAVSWSSDNIGIRKTLILHTMITYVALRPFRSLGVHFEASQGYQGDNKGLRMVIYKRV